MGDRKKVIAPLFEEEIINQDGVSWKQSRDMLRPHFHQRHYSDCAMFQTAVDKLLDVLSTQEGVADLQPLFFALTLEVTTSFLFGTSLSDLESVSGADSSKFGAAFDIAQWYVAKRYRLGGLYWLVNSRRFRRACNTVHQVVDKLIDHSLQDELKHEGRDSGIYMLQQNVQTRADLRSQVINLLVAGRDTTACLLSWSLSVYVQLQVLALLMWTVSYLSDIPESSKSYVRRW
jgi:cytochrome P450